MAGDTARMWIRRAATAVALMLPLLATACVNQAPQLVRDGGDLYRRDTEAAAESRLQALARETGIWVFVVTATEPDPPRMLDEPMAIADARGARAIAVLIGPGDVVSYGASAAATAAGDFDRLAALHDNPAPGPDSAARLDALLTQVEAWVRDGRTPEPVAPDAGEEVGPSGAP